MSFEEITVPGSTKGQMQIAEIVIVMIIFFFILGFGILFYSRFATDDTRREVDEINRLNLAETAKLISTLPELHCSLRGDVDMTCVDLYRAQILAEKMSSDADRLHYSNLFPGYKVELECVYPTPCLYLVFDYTTVGTDTVPFVMPIVIYNATESRYVYGLLHITQVS
jgi:hypothetical protein